MKSLLMPESDRPAHTNEFVKGLSKRAQKVIERHQGWGRDVDGDAWIDGMLGTPSAAVCSRATTSRRRRG